MFAILALSFASCGLDNYDEPTSTIKVNVVYQGQKIGLRDRYVTLQVYQHGYELSNSFQIYSSQDGSFQGSVFDGDYYVTTTGNNGPWANNDTELKVTVNGKSEVDFEVTPYFTISGENISLSGNTVNASFTINQIVSTAKISQVMLLVSKTAFVNEGVYVARKNIDAADAKTGTVNMSLELSSSNQSEKALYGRIGVMTDGADQAIYSEIVKLK